MLISHFGAKTDLPNVRADSYHGACAATRHLLGLGHTRIGFVAGAVESTQAQERLRAYRDTMREHGLLDPDLIPSPATSRSGAASRPRTSPDCPIEQAETAKAHRG